MKIAACGEAPDGLIKLGTTDQNCRIGASELIKSDSDIDRYLDLCSAAGCGSRTFALMMIMIELSVENAVLIPPGHSVCPFDLSEQAKVPVVTKRGNDVRICAIFFRPELQRRGRLSAMIAAIQRARLEPVIIDPIGPAMPALLKHWQWTGNRVLQPYGEFVDEWRPQAGFAIKGGNVARG